MPRLRMVCARCGSDDVLADAYAEWDVDKQEWVVQNTFEKGCYCNYCDSECRIVSNEIKEGNEHVA